MNLSDADVWGLPVYHLDTPRQPVCPCCEVAEPQGCLEGREESITGDCATPGCRCAGTALLDGLCERCWR